MLVNRQECKGNSIKKTNKKQIFLSAISLNSDSIGLSSADGQALVILVDK